MRLSLTERKRILEAVHDSLRGYIYHELSGIPEVREKLKAAGLKLEIAFDLSIGSESSDAQDILASLGTSQSAGTNDGLADWRDMGISMDDLREVAQTEIRRSEEAIQILIDHIR